MSSGANVHSAGHDRAPAAGAPGSVRFQHEFFRSFADIYFRMSEDGEPVAVVSLSKNNEAVMSIDSIRRQFNIPANSPDDEMLGKVAGSLAFVTGVRVGEELPPEINSGDPSWEPSERHFLIAKQRLTLQLVTWVTGDEHIFTSVDELMMLAEDPRTKKNIAVAFGDAAAELGLDRDNHDAVIDQIESLAHQLAYIEAMRDIFDEVRKIDEKIQSFRHLYGADQTMNDTTNQVARLSQACIRQFAQLFEQIDAQTSEVMAMLKNIRNQIEYIKKTRNDLYARLRPWEHYINEWKSVYSTRSNENAAKIRDIYRFLAPRYMKVHEWVLVSKLLPHDSKPIGGQMRW